MILDLDDERAAEPAVAGAKAAWLARGRRARLPVLPGFVIGTDASLEAMARGADVLPRRASGGARSTIWSLPLDEDLTAEAQVHGDRLGSPLVVRSSSVLEGDGRWSGAFSSYLDVGADDIGTAIRGCWASAFSVGTLERYAADGVAPGGAPMAILVQPEIAPSFGGVARLEGDAVRIAATAGSPVPLVQGWDAGVVARVGPDGDVGGDAAIELLGRDLLRAVAATLRTATDRIGATACEWACVDGAVILLQLGQPAAAQSVPTERPRVGLGGVAERIARIVRRAPGPLGETLVLPWAIAEAAIGMDPGTPASAPGAGRPLDILHRARQESSRLAAEVWALPDDEAARRSRALFRTLRSGDPSAAVPVLEGLREPDAGRAERVRSLVAVVRSALVDAGEVANVETAWYVPLDRAMEVLAAGESDRRRDRVGVDRWEPFGGAVVSEIGRRVVGTSAAPGAGFGRLCYIRDLASSEHFRPRDVIVTPDPVPGLGALLWDAAGIVTTGGGPGAHLFEAARSLGLAAVCGADILEALGEPLEHASGRFALSVDGSAGTVDVSPW